MKILLALLCAIGTTRETNSFLSSESGQWSEWFSEDLGGGSAYGSGLISKIQCRGGWCDDQRFYSVDKP